MSDRPLVVITTRLPPATCGVGAYSSLLREHWPAAKSAVEFLVVDSAVAALAGGHRDRITEFCGDALKLTRELERIGAADIVLHYTARAYQRFGCPIWLPGVLARWKRKFPTGRLMIIVHELAGEMPVTSRHFWLGQVDAWIVRRLARIADLLVTNTEHHQKKLRSITTRNDVQLLPVASNIAVTAPRLTSRATTEFVIFGLPFRRSQTLQKFESCVARWHAAGRLTKLHLIGPTGDESTKQADALLAAWPESITIVRHGMLPAAEVSRFLRAAQFALTDVTAATWSKSGAFMACAAHGCAPVLMAADSAPVPLCYAIASNELETITAEEIERRTSALTSWYEENADWPVIATRMAALLQEGNSARAG